MKTNKNIILPCIIIILLMFNVTVSAESLNPEADYKDKINEELQNGFTDESQTVILGKAKHFTMQYQNDVSNIGSLRGSKTEAVNSKNLAWDNVYDIKNDDIRNKYVKILEDIDNQMDDKGFIANNQSNSGVGLNSYFIIVIFFILLSPIILNDN